MPNPTTQFVILQLLSETVFVDGTDRLDGFASESSQQAKELIQYQILSAATLLSAAS